MSLIRFNSTPDRGPSGELWLGIVDWTKGSESLDLFASRIEDFFPYLGDAVGIALSGDSGSAATAQSVQFGVVEFTATQAADAVAGYQVQLSTDLDADTFRRFGMEVRFKVVDDNSTTQTFIGLTDEALDGFFGTDNTPDGSSLGLRWNSDETVDLVSISSSDTITVLIDTIATVERTVGWVKFGFTVEKQNDTEFLLIANLSRTESGTLKTTTKRATTTTIPGAAMKPSVIHTNDNQAAPKIQVDWDIVYDKSDV